MLTNNLGYPRIGKKRELKKANESYWRGEITQKELLQTAVRLRKENWRLQADAGIDLIPSNDFSLYDQVLDICLAVSAIPKRFHPWIESKRPSELDLYFAMARGYQSNGYDLTALEMTKWFDTNYHYMVPEFYENQTFHLLSDKIIREYKEAKSLGIQTKPVIIGPVSFLLLGKEKETGFDKLSLLKNLIPVYIEILKELQDAGAQYIQIEEPFLSLDLSEVQRQSFISTYQELDTSLSDLKIILTSYFDCFGDNLTTALSLPVAVLHLDLVRCPSQLEDILNHSDVNKETIFSLGIIDGRNIWKNNFDNSISIIKRAIDTLGKGRVWIAPSCSLLHVPYDLDLEEHLDPEIKSWMSFAEQKIKELINLKKILQKDAGFETILSENRKQIESRRTSSKIHNIAVQQRLSAIQQKDFKRAHPFSIRQIAQKKTLGLPLLPTTTIGSFPQTAEIRKLREQLLKGFITKLFYQSEIKKNTLDVIRLQESIGLDVLVHGEFERNDMVEYFGELLNGYAFSKYGWVQSYGSRCVKPPILFGDIQRTEPMTVALSEYAQSQTKKWVKGMLTGPITMLEWSFVRDDQSRSETAFQLALAIRDEVADLQKAGIRIIQIDEPALREGLPLRKQDWQKYLDWAVKAFQLSCCIANDTTQIHTHMCYAEFSDILQSIADLDADVITIETSRSQMELLDDFKAFSYPNEVGPGVYDIHSPRVPNIEEIENLLNKALMVIDPSDLWVNPDCGLKTRGWSETQKALENMVKAASGIRNKLLISA